MGKHKMTINTPIETYDADTMAPEEFKEFEERAYKIEGCS